MGRLAVRRRGYALGAEVTGVDGTKPLDPEVVAEIRQALIDHVMIYFPGQKLTPEQFQAFCLAFGPLDTWNIRHLSVLPGVDGVRVRSSVPIQIKGITSRKASTADRWHSDYSYAGRPPVISALLAQHLPEVGGNTMFTNQFAAYETLSPAMQRIVDSLESLRDYTVGAASYPKISPAEQAEARARNPRWVHPLVRTHPVTGRKSLYVDTFVRKFVGMTEEESKPLIDFLMHHSTRYENVYRHAWSVDDLVFWENRHAVHFAVPDFDESQLRSLLSASVDGEACGHRYEAESVAPLVAVAG